MAPIWKCKNNNGLFHFYWYYFIVRHILPIVMYCFTRFVRFQTVRDNQSSKISTLRIFCVKVYAALTYREKNASPSAFTYHVHSRRALHFTSSITHHVDPHRALHFTSSITYHVEPLHITYIYVDGVVHTKRSGSSSFRSIRKSFLRIIITMHY